MAVIHKTNGVSINNATPQNGTTFVLEEMQKIVGGYIEILPLSDGKMLVCNEEGGVNGSELNEIATNIMTDENCQYFPIFGDVLICNSNEIE